MRRILSLYLPNWPAQGNAAGNTASLLLLAEWCGRYTGKAAADLPDGIILDITGCSGDFPDGEAGLVADLERRLGAKGIACRIAVAANAAAAWGLARHGGVTPLLAGMGAEALPALCAELPLAALRLPAPAASGLAMRGVARIGELQAIPSRLLARRIGHEAAARVDLMFGRAVKATPAGRASPDHRVSRRFAQPIADRETLQAALLDLIASMCRRLSDEGIGARHFALTLYRADGAVGAAAVSPARARQDYRYLSRVLKPKLAALDSGVGVGAAGVEVMAIDAMATEPAAAKRQTAHLRLSFSEPAYRLSEDERMPSPLAEAAPFPAYRANAL